MAFEVGSVVMLKEEMCPEGDQRGLCQFPFGEVLEVQPDGSLVIETLDPLFTDVYQPDELMQAVLTDGDSLYDVDSRYEANLDLMSLINRATGDEHFYHLDFYGDRFWKVQDPEAFLANQRKVAKHLESLENLGSMRLVSKKGVMEHLPLDPNTKTRILSFVSGYNVGTSSEREHQDILREWLTRPQVAPAPFTNTRYGRELPAPPPKLPFNLALIAGPLPHGPQESNFQGGTRKYRGKIGTQMARRGTRKSRGIFSRLYSPVGHLFAAGKESVGAVTNTAKGVVGEGIHGLDKIGRSVTTHANMAVKNVFTRKGGKRRNNRKSRRNTRRRR